MRCGAGNKPAAFCKRTSFESSGETAAAHPTADSLAHRATASRDTTPAGHTQAHPQTTGVAERHETATDTHAAGGAAAGLARLRDEIFDAHGIERSNRDRLAVEDAARQQRAARVVLAVPVGAPETIADLEQFRRDHVRRVDPRNNLDAELETAKGVAWLAYGIHGDELSSPDAAAAEPHDVHQLVAVDVAEGLGRDDQQASLGVLPVFWGAVLHNACTVAVVMNSGRLLFHYVYRDR